MLFFVVDQELHAVVLLFSPANASNSILFRYIIAHVLTLDNYCKNNIYQVAHQVQTCYIVPVTLALPSLYYHTEAPDLPSLFLPL